MLTPAMSGVEHVLALHDAREGLLHAGAGAAVLVLVARWRRRSPPGVSPGGRATVGAWAETTAAGTAAAPDAAVPAFTNSRRLILSLIADSSVLALRS